MSMLFGNIADYPVGATFDSRKTLQVLGLHLHNQAGVSGKKAEGVRSIVMSGSYEDDTDNGDTIEYTGPGGNHQTKHQVEHQEWSKGHELLLISLQTQNPVRVFRGDELDSRYAPTAGYRYDGQYIVTNVEHMAGISGFFLWRFRLERIQGQPPIPTRW
ncbi:E3 ubiquitin-protein ligase UHRF1 [Pluteus cervinus]|uniref:E3 ubiquitin-protein ligase UHRF1 n=1 Tax=Pluteus cervinus TaxID=181527 RepID=A0ACD3AZF5_9AGAR|nr:E3 ubiquitin-protein ligase UHRF1 [Pluteus cervinus]